MPETILMTTTDQPLTTTTTMEDIDINTDERNQLDDPPSTSIQHTDDIRLIKDQTQKSLISVYDNNPQQHTTNNSYSLVGIIGRNKRSEAFRKRLLLSGFPKPILCDINSMNEINSTNYVSYEIFYELSPSIILITDNLTTNFEDLFPQDKQQLVIDTREIFSNYFSKKSYVALPTIPGSYRAFGNLSNWEIENGTQRIGVAIEQHSPLNLIKFINDLNCFTHGIYFLDKYSYNNERIKVFRNCLFPLISTIIIFTLYFILSMIECNHEIYNAVLIYRQASSITASTSITLLAFLFLIRPLLEFIEFTYSKTFKIHNLDKNVVLNLPIIQHWLQSRRYLVWYSLSFALLHIIFLIFAKIDFDSKLLVNGFFFGIFTLILLSILSYVHFPWISERLLWNEYYLLTSYLGPFCLLIAFIHVVLHWKSNLNSSNLTFLSLILSLLVLTLRFLIYGILHPIIKLIHWLDNRQFHHRTSTRNTSLLL
ncbi:unnamed protein product [Adineta steineri]|uniref:Uncharacterized protein n=1 Tax=Adineta steineri TaxID=433720 RepID=A0A814PTX2_9BILA|nr:unnamed protein product [Adineta steineri]CAF3707851.1 unnamed protein product [Adineta steineri]